MPAYDGHTTRPVRPVRNTGRRFGVESYGDIDFFWRLRDSRQTGNRLGKIQALPHEDLFVLTIEAGDQAGTVYRNRSYDVLLGVLLLAFDTQ